MPAHRRAACKRAVRALAAAAALVCLAAVAAPAAEVTYLVRPVQIKRAGTEVWVRLNLGDEVNPGDAIRTGTGGRVEITISEKRVFRVGQASEVEVPELISDERRGLRAKLRVLLGRFWGGLLRPLRGSVNEEFEVSTATAVIGVKGTQFGVDHDKVREESQVLVISGQVAARPPPQEEAGPVEVPGPREIAPPQEITRAAWLLLVSQDQKVTIRPDEVPEVVPITPEDRADPWVQFNLQRDAALAPAG